VLLVTISLALAITFRPSRKKGAEDGERVKDDRPRIRPHKDSKERIECEQNKHKGGCPHYRGYDEHDCDDNCYYKRDYCTKKASLPQFNHYKKCPSQEYHNKYDYTQEEREEKFNNKYNEGCGKNDNENNFSNNQSNNAYQQQMMDFNSQHSQPQYSQQPYPQQNSLYSQPSYQQEAQETPHFATYKPRNQDVLESMPPQQEISQKRSFFSGRNKSTASPPEEKPLIFATRKDPNILIMEFSDRLLFFKKCPYGGEPEFLAEELKER